MHEVSTHTLWRLGHEHIGMWMFWLNKLCTIPDMHEVSIQSAERLECEDQMVNILECGCSVEIGSVQYLICMRLASILGGEFGMKMK